MKKGKKCCNWADLSGFFWGAVFILFGILFLLKSMGIIDFTVWTALKEYWPVMLILIGIALILRMRLLAFILLILAVVLGGVLALEGVGIGTGEERAQTQVVPMKDGVENVELALAYGAGDTNIMIGDSDDILKNRFITSDKDDPTVTFTREDGTAKVKIERKNPIGYIKGARNTWNIELNPGLVYNLDCDYGAADLNLDLKGLKVDKVEIDSGASSNLIVFDDYPTKVDINTGASGLNFRFPEGVGVRIEVDGGGVSVNLPGFTQQDKAYVNEDYNEAGENIEIEIDAGATSVEGETY